MYPVQKNVTNKKFIIYSIFGSVSYIEDFDGCLKKRNEIAKIFTIMFENTKKIEKSYKHIADPSGKSINEGIYFNFDSVWATIYFKLF